MTAPDSPFMGGRFAKDRDGRAQRQFGLETPRALAPRATQRCRRDRGAGDRDANGLLRTTCANKASSQGITSPTRGVWRVLALTSCQTGAGGQIACEVQAVRQRFKARTSSYGAAGR